MDPTRQTRLKQKSSKFFSFPAMRRVRQAYAANVANPILVSDGSFVNGKFYKDLSTDYADYADYKNKGRDLN
jgi:hypothetical protein